MDADLIIGMLKIASVVLGGVLGVAAVLIDYHDESNNLTRAGKWVLTGIICSAVVGSITSGVETYKAGASSREQAARTEAVLREVSRSILPIRELSLYYWIEIPPGLPIVDRYIERISKGIAERLPDLTKLEIGSEPKHKGLHAWAIGKDGEVLNVTIKKDADLWPHLGEEMELLAQLIIFPITVDILRTPIKPDEFYPIRGSSDFGAMSFAARRFDLDWDLKKRRLTIIGETTFDKNMWMTNGKVTSTIDLYGSQIFVLLPGRSKIIPPSMKELGAKSEFGAKFGENLNLIIANFDFGDGRSLKLRGKHFKKSSYIGGNPVFSVILPKTEKEMVDISSERDD